MPGGLADDFEVSHDGVNCPGILREGLPGHAARVGVDVIGVRLPATAPPSIDSHRSPDNVAAAAGAPDGAAAGTGSSIDTPNRV